VDAGWEVERLREVIGKLGLAEQVQVEARDVMKGAVRGKLVSVNAAEQQAHRHLHHIEAIIAKADLPEAVKSNAIGAFTKLAAAEAKVHNSTIQKVHFHEVGALDAIVDIVGTCAGIAALNIERLYASPLPLGDGWVQTQHGKLPLPAPATLELLAAARVPTRPAPGSGEFVTPTGAALVAQLATFSQPAMRLEKIALGAGTKDLAWPNLARLWLGEFLDEGPYVQIETNIDDMNPQLYQAVTERLFAAGAVDVWTTPIQMKKGRPAVTLSALGPANREPEMGQIMLKETTTLGLRVTPVRRHELVREVRMMQTPWGELSVKLKWLGQKIVGASVEYEDARAAAAAKDLSVKEVYEGAMAMAYERFVKG
jgi:uncharacterized protein (TIGR00299 family) protein